MTMTAAAVVPALSCFVAQRSVDYYKPLRCAAKSAGLPFFVSTQVAMNAVGTKLPHLEY